MCKRHNNWLPPAIPLLGTWPETQACALTGNWSDNPLVHSLALNLLSHTSQGLLWTNLKSIAWSHHPSLNWWRGLRLIHILIQITFADPFCTLSTPLFIYKYPRLHKKVWLSINSLKLEYSMNMYVFNFYREIDPLPKKCCACFQLISHQIISWFEFIPQTYTQGQFSCFSFAFLLTIIQIFYKYLTQSSSVSGTLYHSVDDDPVWFQPW